MADLDAELLALAGGDDSSDEETSVPVHSKHDSPPDSNGAEQPHAESTDTMGRRGIAKPVNKSKRRVKDDDEDEEGELYVWPLTYATFSCSLPMLPLTLFPRYFFSLSIFNRVFLQRPD